MTRTILINRNNSFIKVLLTCSFLLVSTFLTVSAADYTSVATGNWSIDATWSGTGIPGSTDNITVSTYTVTYTGNFSTSGTIKLNSGTLIFNGNLTSTGQIILDGGKFIDCG